MSDTVQIAGLITALISTMFTGIMAYLMARLKQGQEEVKKDLAVSTKQQDVKLDRMIHVTDGLLSGQMKIAADALQLVADKTGDAGHIATAQNARRDYLEHEASLAAAHPGLATAPIAVVVVNPAEAPAMVKLAEHGEKSKETG